MNNKKTTEYISLEEATKYCPYSQEYLSLRARQGKLKAIKLGRNWVTKKEWLEEYLAEVEEVKEEHLSLQEATKYCQYSQEYLSLRARQGKLRATKIGRNWLTKKEWLEEYLAKVEEYNNLKTERIKELRKVKREVLPPENLPIGEPQFVPIRVPVREFPVFRLGFAAALIIVLILAGGIFGRKSFENVFEDISLFAYQGLKSIAKLLEKPEKIVEEPIIPKPGEKEGMVVIPSTEEDELMKEKIKIAFSDEVKVEPEDKTSGIITPVFRIGEGDRYLYILVPIKN